MGRAFAERFGRAGAHIVAADVEGPALDAAVEAMRADGISVEGIVTDVADEASMDALAAAVFAEHPNVHLLFNNAGVGGGGRLSECTTADWEWVLGVNLWGVAHGLRLFLPNMIEHGDGHIINTASVAGHTSFPGLGIYNATKHAVVTLSETLHAELVEDAPTVGVSVLCPGIVNTRILESDRNRPEMLSAPGMTPERTEEEEQVREMVTAIFAQALAPEAVADMVFDAVRDNQFYIFTDGEYDEAIKTRHTAIQTRTNPAASAGLVDLE